MCLPVTRISASYVLLDRSALSLYLCVFCHIFVGQWRFFSSDQWEAASDTIEFQTRLDSWAIISGRVAEWLKAPDSKSGDGAIHPWVQIPPLPPIVGRGCWMSCKYLSPVIEP